MKTNQAIGIAVGVGAIALGYLFLKGRQDQQGMLEGGGGSGSDPSALLGSLLNGSGSVLGDFFSPDNAPQRGAGGEALSKKAALTSEDVAKSIADSFNQQQGRAIITYTSTSRGSLFDVSPELRANLGDVKSQSLIDALVRSSPDIKYGFNPTSGGAEIFGNTRSGPVIGSKKASSGGSSGQFQDQAPAIIKYDPAFSSSTQFPGQYQDRAPPAIHYDPRYSSSSPAPRSTPAPSSASVAPAPSASLSSKKETFSSRSLGASYAASL